VSGLQGSLVLRNNGGDDLTVAADGPFTLATSIETGGTYLVTIQTQPAAQVCVLANGSGPVADANVVSVTVTCSPLQATQLQAAANVSSANLSWSNPNNASAFNVYVSSAPHCDIQNFSACPDGALRANVTSPFMVEELRNGQAYFFQVDATLSDGRHQLSNEASTRPNVLAFNDFVQAIAVGQDGTQYVGGNFTAVGIASGGAVPFDATSGQPSMPDFPIVTGIVTGGVFATVSDRAGGWYIGGLFTQVGGQARKNLAHIFGNGTVDPNFSPNFDNPIDALAFSGDTLYVGGEFTTADGLPRNRLAAFDTNGTLLNWNPNVSGGDVFALALAGDVVYAGGSFSGIGAVGLHHVAAIGGKTGTPLLWEPNVLGTVLALEVSGDTVYVGGEFPGVDNKTRRNLAAISAISATGTAGQVLPWNPDADGSVAALAVAGNTVYVGGSFHTVAGTARNHLAAVDATDAGPLLDWRPDANDLVVSALKAAGGTIYVGFRSDDGVKGNNLAAISTEGQVLAWNPAPNDDVLALAIADNTVFAGGIFTGIASTTRNSVAAIDSQGRLTSWDPDVNRDVRTLTVDGNTVYAGGLFSQVKGQTRNNLAAISTEGALLDWSPGTDDSVSVLAVSDNTVYVGGSFTHVTTAVQGTQARGHLAAIGTTDGALLNWNPSVNNTVNTLLVSGGTVYVGGAFTNITADMGPTPRSSLAAIGTDGKLSNWDPNAIGPVIALAIIDDTLYVGGGFVEAGNPVATRKHLFAVGTNGVLKDWQADTDGEVRALAVSGNTVYASGPFVSVAARNGTKLVNGLAAIHVNGDLLLDWSPDADDLVTTLAVFDNTVYAGGQFNALTDLSRFFFGAIDAGSGEVIP